MNPKLVAKSEYLWIYLGWNIYICEHKNYNLEYSPCSKIRSEFTLTHIKSVLSIENNIIYRKDSKECNNINLLTIKCHFGEYWTTLLKTLKEWDHIWEKYQWHCIIELQLSNLLNYVT